MGVDAIEVSTIDEVDTMAMADGLEQSGRARPVSPRRRWSEAEKRRIVSESYRPGASVSVVARRNDVNANLVFRWRQRYRDQGGFVPVVVEPDRLPAPLREAVTVDPRSMGRIEIALADGSRVIVDREVDGTALARVLSVLARR